jgi:hypothetical protein
MQEVMRQCLVLGLIQPMTRTLALLLTMYTILCSIYDRQPKNSDFQSAALFTRSFLILRQGITLHDLRFAT